MGFVTIVDKDGNEHLIHTSQIREIKMVDENELPFPEETQVDDEFPGWTPDDEEIDPDAVDEDNADTEATDRKHEGE